MVIGHSKIITLKNDDINEDGYIKAPKLFHLIEDVSSEHADILHAGFDDLISRNLIWVLSKVKYEMHKPVKPSEEYTIETFPRPKKAVTFGRDYYIRDADGNMIMEGTSQWCILDFESRKIAKTDIDFKGDYKKEKALGNAFEKIHEKTPELVQRHIVLEEDLDVNRHVNNGRYVEMVCEASGRDVFTSFNIYFAKESRIGDEIYIYREKQDDRIVVQGKFPDGTVIFQAKGE